MFNHHQGWIIWKDEGLGIFFLKGFLFITFLLDKSFPSGLYMEISAYMSAIVVDYEPLEAWDHAIRVGNGKEWNMGAH